MMKKRFSVGKIVAVLKQGEAGLVALERELTIARGSIKTNASSATFPQGSPPGPSSKPQTAMTASNHPRYFPTTNNHNITESTQHKICDCHVF